MQLRTWASTGSSDRYPKLIMAAALVVALLYAVYHLAWGNAIIGALALGSAATVIPLLAGLRRPAVTDFLFLGFFCFQLAALTLTSYFYGVRGLLLLFPIINGLFYVYKNISALVLSLLFIVCCLTAASHSESPDLLARAALAIALCVIFAAGFTHTMSAHNSQLHYVATHDSLTDLRNRRGFLAWLQTALAQCQNNQGDLALFYFDLDGFKQINDRYGHDVGDQVLISFARRLVSSLRQRELIKNNSSIDNVGRLSGDEFVCALVGNFSEEDTRLISERMLKSIQEPMSIEHIAIELDASIGVSLASHHDYQLEELLVAADAKMYQVKHRQRRTRQPTV